MCNYGMSAMRATSEIVDSVREALRDVHAGPGDTLFLSPSGSLLDPRELPEDARDAVLAVARDVPAGRFLFEARPQDVTREHLEVVRSFVRAPRVAVETGVESTDPWVLKHSLCKSIDPDRGVRPMLAVAHNAKVGALANVLVGAPFLSIAEAVEDSVQTARWCLGAGFEQVVLFPVQAKTHTLVGWLAERGFCDVPSLWMLIEVIERLGATQAAKLSVSWHRDYLRMRGPVFRSPTTCPNCLPEVLAALDAFKLEPSAAFRMLARLRCDCRTAWREQAQNPGGLGRVARATAAYELIGASLLPDWWKQRRADVLASLLSPTPL